MAIYFEFKSIAELLEDNCNFDSNQREMIQNSKASFECQECMLAGALAGLEDIFSEYVKEIQECHAKLLEYEEGMAGEVKITEGNAEGFELTSGAGLDVHGDPAKAGGAKILPHTSGSEALGGAGHPEDTETVGMLPHTGERSEKIMK